MSKCKSVHIVLKERTRHILISQRKPAHVLLPAAKYMTPLLPPESLQLQAEGNEIVAMVDTYSEGIIIEGYNWYLDGNLIETTEGPEYRFTGLEYGTPYQVQASVTARIEDFESGLTEPETITLMEG